MILWHYMSIGRIFGQSGSLESQASINQAGAS